MEENMIKENELICPNCGKNLKRHDCVKRHYRTKGGVRKYILVERMKCIDCGKIHRVIPDFLCAYKHYEKEIISGVLEGLITSDTIGYEDFPCEMTMTRWLNGTFHFCCFNKTQQLT